MKRFKVLVLSHMYPSRAAPTSGVFIHNHVRHLIALGCEVMVVSPIPYTPSVLATNQRRKVYRETPRQDVIDGVLVIYPRYLRPPGSLFHAPSALTMYAGVLACIGRIVKEFDPQLIHAHTATPDGYVGLLLSKKLGIPLVVSLRGSDVNVYPFRDRWTLGLTKKVLAKAHKVTAVSKALKETAEAIASPRAPIEVIYNGADVKQFTFDPEPRNSIRQKLGISADSVVLIFVGNVLREKGVEDLMQSFCTLARDFQELHLVVVGDGPALDGLVSKAEEVRVGNRVHFVGRRPHHEIPGWLSASDILVLPSWREGLPNVVLEAMACSRPVVATRVGGIPEAVQPGESGILVERGDVRALTEAIAQLICDPVKREAMGQAGRRIVEDRFTWEKNAKRTIALYHEVLNEYER